MSPLNKFNLDIRPQEEGQDGLRDVLVAKSSQLSIRGKRSSTQHSIAAKAQANENRNEYTQEKSTPRKGPNNGEGDIHTASATVEEDKDLPGQFPASYLVEFGELDKKIKEKATGENSAGASSVHTKGVSTPKIEMANKPLPPDALAYAVGARAEARALATKSRSSSAGRKGTRNSSKESATREGGKLLDGPWKQIKINKLDQIIGNMNNSFDKYKKVSKKQKDSQNTSKVEIISEIRQLISEELKHTKTSLTDGKVDSKLWLESHRKKSIGLSGPK